MKVICKVCGVYFSANRSTRKICGSECANKLMREYHRKGKYKKLLTAVALDVWQNNHKQKNENNN